MHIVLKRGSIDKPLTFNNGLYTIYNSLFILVCSPNTYACKVFSIQIFQYTIRQIPPRVCTLVLFIMYAHSLSSLLNIWEFNSLGVEGIYTYMPVVKLLTNAYYLHSISASRCVSCVNSSVTNLSSHNRQLRS